MYININFKGVKMKKIKVFADVIKLIDGYRL